MSKNRRCITQYIESCVFCPHYDQTYGGCTHINRDTSYIQDVNHIPNWCPLPKPKSVVR